MTIKIIRKRIVRLITIIAITTILLTYFPIPTLANGDTYASVSLSSSHSMVIYTDNSLWAWGGNSAGELSDGTTTDRLIPIKIMDKKLLLGISATSPPVHVTHSSWKTLYYEKIIELTDTRIGEMSWFGLINSFYLADMDADGVPELVHYSSYDVSGIVGIYTVADNKVVLLDNSRYSGTSANPVAVNKFTGDLAMICGRYTNFLGNDLPPGTTYQFGELYKHGQILEYIPRFEEIVREDHLLDYYTISSQNIHQAVSKSEYDQSVSEFRASFEDSPQLNGRYIITEDADFLTSYYYNVPFEPTSLYTQNLTYNNWEDFVNKDIFELLNMPNIDLFLNSFIADEGDDYIYTPTEPNQTITRELTPGVFEDIRDADTAIAAIGGMLAGMTPEQRVSGDSLDEVALWIENALKHGASGRMTGESVSVDANALNTLIASAWDIMAAAEDMMSAEDISLLRWLRSDVRLMSSEEENLSVSFEDDMRSLDFDRLTVEAPFASLTVDRQELRGNQAFSVSKTVGDDERAPESSPTGRSGTLDLRDGQGDKDGSGGQDVFRIEEQGASERSGLLALLRYWGAFPVVSLGLVFILNKNLHRRPRGWVMLTAIGIVAIANVCTLVLIEPKGSPPGEPGGVRVSQGRAVDDKGPTGAPYGTQDGRASSRRNQETTYGILLELDNISLATLSIPVSFGEADYLVIYDEDGQPVYSKYNPATNTVDARVREGGLYTVKENRVSFIDIEKKNDMMQEAILQLASKGIMAGTTDGFFFPDKMITRAEYVSAIVRMFDLLDLNAESTFEDIDRSDWYYAAAASAQIENVISGFEDNTFRGEQDMPKDQMIVASSNTLVSQMNYKVPREVESLLERYVDRPELAAWSLDGIALSTQANVLIYRTDSRFAPAYPMTRGDAAIILNRIFMKVW